MRFYHKNYIIKNKKGVRDFQKKHVYSQVMNAFRSTREKIVDKIFLYNKIKTEAFLKNRGHTPFKTLRKSFQKQHFRKNLLI